MAARASSFWFKNKAAETSEIGSKLRVANLLQGSVRRAGNRLRVTVQLVNAENGFQLWSERYDRQMEDIFEIQDEIARGIAGKLRVTLSGVAKPATTNAAAYEMYLKGRHFWHLRTPNALQLAMECFRETIRMDPQFALAYAGLADCYCLLHYYGWTRAEEVREDAHAAVMEAVRLEPERWEVIYSRAIYTFYFERSWRSAEADFRTAVAINPRSSLAQVYLGMFYLQTGRPQEGVRHIESACELDPLSASIQGIAAGCMIPLERYEDAERFGRRALELQPDFLAGLCWTGMAVSALERHEEAIQLLERAVSISRAPIFLGGYGCVLARAGRDVDVQRVLQELDDRASRGEYIPALTRTSIHVGCSDVPAIRQALAKAIEEGAAPLSVVGAGYLLLTKFRYDPEIDRMHRQLFGW